jgi:DNA-binding Lrp family transcriptional regulator
MPRDVEPCYCPHCGHEFQPELWPLERQLIYVVEKICRHSGAASSRAVGLELALSRSQAARHLRKAEERGYLRRVGVRGGWRRAA